MCLFWSTTTKNFSVAKADCQGRGARLGVFNDADKMEILRRKGMAMKTNIWVGVDDIEVEGTWKWHDGSILPESSYWPVFFNDGQPNNYDDQDCGHYWSKGTKLADEKCSAVFYYVCEKI
ncbi:C-type lectin domain family 4 member M [Biomphalaria glabrata]|nr:C-type lectin domain family 4 member M [Biomphalaria glabrata]